MAAATRRIAVLHGPNLNLLGEREPTVYGLATLADIDAQLGSIAAEIGVSIETAQHNGEGEMIDTIHSWRGGRISGAIVNAAAYSHTSLAIRDALVGVRVPFVEVHLSNVHAREPMRHHSMLAAVALGVIAGFGPDSYYLGLRALVSRLPAYQ